MKRVLLVLLPAAFVAGIFVGRKMVSPPKVEELALPAPAAAPVAPPPAMIAAGESDLDADTLAQQALEQYVKGNYYRAIDIATRAQTLVAKQPLAGRILGAAR